MSKIHLLDNGLINKIAAGEVIERPASVVKELVENSIDAGASVIMVSIRDGGTSLITVADNGCGIEEEEVKNAFIRHATSKIEKFDDLEDVATMGFRGEALASIAAVSQMEMITKTADSVKGTSLKINGGRIEEVKSAGAANGTVIHVKNLFYNTPARKKFLKRNSTEGSYIADTINKIALGHPNVAFKLINNGVIIMQTNGRGDIKTTAYSILGRDVIRSAVEINAEKDGWQIDGFIVKPEVSRGNRSYEHFYINGRYIKSDVLTKAAEEGYKGYLMNGRFPVFLLNIKPAAGAVDVNVHPAKLEVRFDNEGFICSFLAETVAKALKGETLIPEIKEEESFSKKSGIEPLRGEEINIDLDAMLSKIERQERESSARGGLADKKPAKEESDPVFDIGPVEPLKLTFREDKYAKTADITPLKDILNEIRHKEKADGIASKENQSVAGNMANEENKADIKDNINSGVQNTMEELTLAAERKEELEAEQAELKKEMKPQKANILPPKQKKRAFFSNYKIIGQVFLTYWLIEQGNELYIVDQHAAHEKVLYEKFVESIRKRDVASQLLLEPVSVNVTLREKRTIEENMELFKSIGFDVEQFGLNTYIIRAVPFIFDGTANPVFFTEIVDALSDGRIRDGFELKQDKIATMSCKAAVKGNNVLNYQEAKALIEELLKLDNPFNCPHGRPTIIKMSKYEIEKKFKRII